MCEPGTLTMPDTRSSLLSRVKNLDDASSWEEFDGLYRPLLVSYARARGLSQDEAEDIAQQCMAAIVTGIRSFERRVSFRGWLHGMIDHKVSDRLRKRQLERGARTADFDRADTREANPALPWERQWNRTHLLYCLNQIRDEIVPATYQAFEMYVLHEKPVAEISEALAMSPNQIYVAKHRVMARIRKQWDRLADGIESGRLPDHQADRILPHVTACGTCNRTLDRLRSEDLDGRVLRAALRDHAAAIVALALINKFL